MKPLPTIRERLLRIHLIIAFTAVILFFVGVSMLDWKLTQQALMVHFANDMHAAAEGAAQYVQAHDMQGLKNHLHDFQVLPGIRNLCVYNDDGRPLAAWKAADSDTACPQFIMREGMERHWLDASTAIMLMHNKTYLGMFYAHSRLTAWHTIFWRDSVALLSLLFIAYGACRLSSRHGAYAIATSLTALEEQIHCLQHHDYTVCALLPPMTTHETATLAQSITDFRKHLAMETLPRNDMKKLHHWYGHVGYGLLRSLRQQLEADSALLDTLDDYEQLLRIQSGASLPEPILFDATKLLRNVVHHVREKFPEQPEVFLNASLQSTMPQQWVGQPKILAMLLRHLLYIALKRTHRGPVSLSLGAEKSGFCETAQLTVTLKDSGAPLQRWQLTHWLSGSPDSVVSTVMTRDISWLMAGQLVHTLGGTATAETDSRAGLLLTVTLPIEQAQAGLENTSVSLSGAAPNRHKGMQPLLLLVEESLEKRSVLSELFESLHCRAFIVASHAQAMVWAPVLPFSALVLNGSLPDACMMTVKRIQHLSQENLMPLLPIWAMVGTLTVDEENYWHRMGVYTFLIQPLNRPSLELLCDGLAMPGADFYLAYDTHLQNDFPVNVIMRLPELRREIGNQVGQLYGMLVQPTEDMQRALICQQAHAVKSGSLSLGYFRLAALMAEIEHALANKTFAQSPRHWQIVADALHCTFFEEQERASA